MCDRYGRRWAAEGDILLCKSLCQGEIVGERTLLSESTVRSQAQRLPCNSVQLQPHAYSGSICQRREYG